jgi:hypothetical protein
MDWKSEELPKIIDGYQLKDMFSFDETGLFYNLQTSKTLTYKGVSCHGGIASKQRVTVLLLQCEWHREIAFTGNWQIQQTLLLQKYKKTLYHIHSRFQFMEGFNHF